MKLVKISFLSLILMRLISDPGSAYAAADTTDERMEENSKPLLVIFGASYAGSWPIERIGQWEVINRGVSGDETGAMLERFDRDVAVHHPKAVLIWGFINDIFRSDPAAVQAKSEQTMRNIAEMVDRVTELEARVVLSTEITLPLYRSWDERIVHYLYPLIGRSTYPQYINQHVDRLNDWIRDFAASRGLPLLDFASVLTDDTGARSADYAAADGSHLNAAAYARLSEYVMHSDLGL